ncbi:TetR family transcriptional regulator C-terminal domain-containing protein [Niastella populi]|uniref:Biofilm operon icaADBC HTH-type negative transcriptional regulator IcaR n=1 Tax=Niastella populi TaxID=550983 RepID=A0A1V9GDC6_9BACT|nr:TetR family transcriptional regulator C-terminal domain-containing protein [Niastella populi]OQP68600.1 TetR family transcriptional regulator [Niastella populi]
MGRKSLKTPRQKEIIKAFYKLAKKEGLENASIAKTAALLDMNPSLVLHYFQTKESLVYGLIEYILDKYLLIYNIPTEDATEPKKALLKVIDNIFSAKWNTLFDDSVSYSCYALAFRDKTIKEKYKRLLDTLRQNLQQLIMDCKAQGILSVKDPALTADLIFVLVDGAYYYLCLVSDKEEYKQKLALYKKQAISLLNLTASAQLVK